MEGEIVTNLGLALLAIAFALYGHHVSLIGQILCYIAALVFTIQHLLEVLR